MNDQFMTFAEACALLQISYTALARRVEAWPNHPRPKKLFTAGQPKVSVFDRQEMLAWLATYDQIQDQLRAHTMGPQKEKPQSANSEA